MVKWGVALDWLLVLGWRRSRSTQTSKVSGSKFLLLFFLWLHLVCSSCRAPMAWCFPFSFFGLFFNALSAFYNPTCGWIDLFSLQIWGRKEQQPQCNCNPCTSSDDLLFTVPCVHSTHQWLKHWSLLCCLVASTHLSNRSLFWQRKALLTSLATTCKNTFSPRKSRFAALARFSRRATVSKGKRKFRSFKAWSHLWLTWWGKRYRATSTEINWPSKTLRWTGTVWVAGEEPRCKGRRAKTKNSNFWRKLCGRDGPCSCPGNDNKAEGQRVQPNISTLSVYTVIRRFIAEGREFLFSPPIRTGQ